ncbi:MAG TPA: NAD(+)/NADH kinase [Terriglobales bacterium]|nr:NAD(+)/NADH kinase [Terriglobales bacterium]
MEKAQKVVAIISKPGQPEIGKIVERLNEWLHAHGFSMMVDAETAEQAKGFEVVERDAIAARKPEFAIVLGGDGTLLAAARAVSKAGIPILAVNLGSLGFLTEVPLSELFPVLEAMHERRSRIDNRSMLHCQLMRNEKCIGDWDALNDVVVNKSTLARIADFDVELNGAFISNYKADALIISTPTGSTAYSLAAGGPILAPDVTAFVITPVSPHALTNRPLVVEDSANIAIQVNGAEGMFLTVDGQVGMPLQQGDRVQCRKSGSKVQLFRQSNTTFFDVLRQKLKWGQR